MLKRLFCIPKTLFSEFRTAKDTDFVKTFEELALPPKVLGHLKNFDAPSEIQSKSMKLLLEGNDMISIAPTGSGKTLAFSIPAIMKSSQYQRKMGVSTLIICPTRQLSNQITETIAPIAGEFGLRVANIFGGAPKRQQFYQARVAQIIVATPGRLRDYALHGAPNKFKNVKALILDEADRMLDFGFEQQIKEIIQQTSPERQTALFSATWQKQVQIMASQIIKPDAYYIQIGNNAQSINPNIQQLFKHCSFRAAKQTISKIINESKLKKILIFCNTKNETRDVAFELNDMTDRKINYITSDLTQDQRTLVMNQFRQSQDSVMIATDVASRGIDVKDIELVINYGFPTNSADFIHRVGRTGRGGKTGQSLTFIFKGDVKTQKSLRFIAELYQNDNLEIPESFKQIIEQLGVNILKKAKQPIKRGQRRESKNNQQAGDQDQKRHSRKRPSRQQSNEGETRKPKKQNKKKSHLHQQDLD